MSRSSHKLLLAASLVVAAGGAAVAQPHDEPTPGADAGGVAADVVAADEVDSSAVEPTSAGADAEMEAPALSAPAPADAHDQARVDLWSKVTVGTKWYLSSGYGESGGDAFTNTRITRGYLTFKFKQSKWFEPRVTFDAHQNDEGDWGVRLKYMYAKFKLPRETAFITEPNVEFGLVHGPWFDYEEHIDNYRMQGQMFIERNKVLNSADAGITIAGLFGKKLAKDYQKKVSKKYPGEWGSFAFGLYNGGGYHAPENNKNKVFESRVSVRPAGPHLPNLQLSHFAVFGRGNTPAGPEWRLNAVMASFEHQYFTLTAQYATGKGDQKGAKVDAVGDPLDFSGYSAFAEAKLPDFKSTLIARYDFWEWDEAETTRFIVGYAYHFLPHNFVLIDYDRIGADDYEIKATMQVAFP